jgi:hypothetical protein
MIGNIFDTEYLSEYNVLTYNNLCTKTNKNAKECSMLFG